VPRPRMSWPELTVPGPPWPEVVAPGSGRARGRAPPPTDQASLAGGDASPAVHRWYFVGEVDGAAAEHDDQMRADAAAEHDGQTWGHDEVR
jgi:hypothetical protein